MLVGLSYHGSRMLHDLSCGCHDVTALQPKTENGWPNGSAVSHYKVMKKRFTIRNQIIAKAHQFD